MAWSNMGGHEDILNRQWKLRGNFNKQVAAIQKTISMSQQQINSLEILYEDIEQTFSRIWPGIRVKPFGSIVTNLALKNSDVDCFVELPTGCDDEPEACVEKCRDLIAQGPSPFRDANVTLKKVPTVQFVHTHTRRSCELSFNKPIAVEFNKLVRYLLAVDPRALKLAMLVKYWAKIHDVTGSRWVPSNALLILIIFFLQLKKILPPVASLQENVAPNTVEGWNTAFTETSYEARNDRSVYNLLKEFFDCYAQFDFGNLVVCPYLGVPLERDQFRTASDAPRDFHLYKRNVEAGACEPFNVTRILCIQDPFEHARNVAGPVRKEAADHLLRAFTRAALVCATTAPHALLNTLLSRQYNDVTEHEAPPRPLPRPRPRPRRPARSRRRAQARPY